VTVDDLARFGQLILDRGAVSGKQIIPESWIDDTTTRGSQSAWQKGDFVGLLPKGCYRNQWYQVGDEDHSIMALGIHGQWLYINPTSEVVIAKMASQPEPADDRLDEQTLRVFSELCRSL
jgi:CubicO group peptidase (beta-lactamase class C family)